MIYDAVYEDEPAAVKKLILPSSCSLSLAATEMPSTSSQPMSAGDPNGSLLSSEEQSEILNIFDEFRREVLMMK